MATTKLATLAIRTLAKPISNTIKQQAKELSPIHSKRLIDDLQTVLDRHETFRRWCVSIAQSKHRAEVKLRTNLLGEPSPNIRPLSEARAIDNGANAIAEGFLFAVAASLIIGETWRSSRSQAKRRDIVDEQIDDLSNRIEGLSESVKALEARFEEQWVAEKERNERLHGVLNQIVNTGLRRGFEQLDDTPLRLAKTSHHSVPPDRED